MSNPTDVCAKPGCGESRADHDWRNHAIAHAFVEPPEAAPDEAAANVLAQWTGERTGRTTMRDFDLERLAALGIAAGRKTAFGEAEAIVRNSSHAIHYGVTVKSLADAIAARAKETP